MTIYQEKLDIISIARNVLRRIDGTEAELPSGTGLTFDEDGSIKYLKGESATIPQIKILKERVPERSVPWPEHHRDAEAGRLEDLLRACVDYTGQWTEGLPSAEDVENVVLSSADITIPFGPLRSAGGSDPKVWWSPELTPGIAYVLGSPEDVGVMSVERDLWVDEEFTRSFARMALTGMESVWACHL